MIELLKKDKLIVILRGLRREQVAPTAEALRAAGVHFVEVTFAQNSPTCVEDTSWAIRTISECFPELHVGAGTVITLEQVEAAHAAGAKYIISPNADEEIIRRTVELGMLSMPGAFSPSEIVSAYKWGASFVKLFPAGNLGAAYVKAIRAPISHIPMLAVGGVDLENMEQFYRAGIDGFGIGGSIIRKDLIEKGDYAALTELAEKYVALTAALGRG